jgi:hypothetical protein
MINFPRIDIDLNDRIFCKTSFGNNNEDYNRVLNQLITFDNFYETKNFIDEMVKQITIIGKEKIIMPSVLWILLKKSFYRII